MHINSSQFFEKQDIEKQKQDIEHKKQDIKHKKQDIKQSPDEKTRHSEKT